MGRRVRDEDEVERALELLRTTTGAPDPANQLLRSDADNVNVPFTLFSRFQSW